MHSYKSDGAQSSGVGISAAKIGATRMRVLSYDDVVQWTGKVDAKGQVSFRRPAGKFYVQFIAADGH